MKDDYKVELEKLRRQAQLLDYTMVAVGFALLLSIGVVVFNLHDDPIESLVITALTGFVLLQLVGKLHGYLVPRVAKEYVIVEDGNVRKLFGSFKFNDTYLASQDLLKPGYKTFQGNTFEQYGCTLAAVKCEKEDIKN